MAYLLHQLLTESAGRQPDAEAVRLLDQAMTYAELNRLSSQVAHALIANGIMRGDGVGILHCTNPQRRLPQSIFGIMKTGACSRFRWMRMRRACVAGNRPSVLAFGHSSRVQRFIESRAHFFHDDCPINAIFFVDQAPKACLPSLPSPEDLPKQPDNDPKVEAIDHDLAYILHVRLHRDSEGGHALTSQCADFDLGVKTFGSHLTIDSQITHRSTLISPSSIFLSRSRPVQQYALVRRGCQYSRFQLSSHPRPKDHRLVLGPDGPDPLLQTRGKLEQRGIYPRASLLMLFPGKSVQNRSRALMEKLSRPRYANLYGPTETNVCAYYEVEPLPQEQTAPIPIGRAGNTEPGWINAEGNE